MGNEDPSSESHWFPSQLSDTSLSSEEEQDEEVSKNKKLLPDNNTSLLQADECTASGQPKHQNSENQDMKQARESQERVETTDSNQSKCKNVGNEDPSSESPWFPSQLSDTSLLSEEEQDEDQLTKMKNIRKNQERVENTGSNQSKCQKVGNEDPSSESPWFPSQLSDTSLLSEEEQDEDQLTKMKNTRKNQERVENTGSNQSKCQKVGNEDPSSESPWFPSQLSDTSLLSEEEQVEEVSKNKKLLPDNNTSLLQADECTDSGKPKHQNSENQDMKQAREKRKRVENTDSSQSKRQKIELKDTKGDQSFPEVYEKKEKDDCKASDKAHQDKVCTWRKKVVEHLMKRLALAEREPPIIEEIFIDSAEEEEDV